MGHSGAFAILSRINKIQFSSMLVMKEYSLTGKHASQIGDKTVADFLLSVKDETFLRRCINNIHAMNLFNFFSSFLLYQTTEKTIFSIELITLLRINVSSNSSKANPFNQII